MIERPVPTRLDALLIIEESALEANNFVRSRGVDYIDGFQGITPEELLGLGRNILGSSGVAEAYELLAQMTSSGDGCYYDRIIGEPQHLETYKRLDMTMRQHERRRVARAIDIGGGTGMCGVLASQVSEHVTVTDLSTGLLTRANEFLSRAGQCKTHQTIVANALELSFPEEERFDIAVSNAVTHYLTFQEKEEFYRRIHGLLKPGGRYYEPQQAKSDYIHKYNASPRARLAGDVASTVLLIRGNKVIQEQKQGLPDPEKYGFKVAATVFQEMPFTKQVMHLTKV